MEDRLLALRLVLEELAIPLDVSSLDSRKLMQKAVYLAQAADVPLGYPFNWYVLGPYSPELTDDYFAVGTESEIPLEQTLRDDVRSRLEGIKPLIEKNAAEQMTRPDWLELLASWLYLRVNQGKTRDQAQQSMDRLKPRLAPKGATAERLLADQGLLAAARM